jgi:prepilin peptidase CpaA
VASAVEWAAIGGVAVVASLGDLRTGRVPNVLTFGAGAAGVCYSAFHGGLAALGPSVLGYLLGVAVFLPLFALGGMGAGDVKLFGAFGAWLGPVGVLWAALWASLAGGALALVIGARRGYLREAFRNLAVMVGVWRIVGPSPVAGITLSESRGPRLAFAVPIGIGALLALWRNVS